MVTYLLDKDRLNDIDVNPKWMGEYEKMLESAILNKNADLTHFRVYAFTIEGFF